MIQLTQEHKDAGLELGEDDPDFMALKLNGELKAIWYWRDVTQEGVTWAADKYLESCPEAKHYETTYDWCNLGDNICTRNTGNALYDKPCDYYSDFLNKVNEKV